MRVDQQLPEPGADALADTRTYLRIARALGNEALAADHGLSLGGFAAHGASLRAALAPVLDAMPHQLVDDGHQLRLSARPQRVEAIEPASLGAHSGATGGPAVASEQQGSDRLPDEVALRYYEPARDYQTGLQRVFHDAPGQRQDRIDLPAALAAPVAKSLAADRLANHWAERVTARISLPWRDLALRPGTAIAFDGAQWKIVSATLEHMAWTLECVRLGQPATVAAPLAAAGRAVAAADQRHGPTVVQAIDVPGLPGAPASGPRLYIAAAGREPGWRSAALELSIDGGQSFEAIGPTAPPAVIGTVETPPLAGGCALFDAAGRCEVQLLHDEMWLTGRDDDSLVAGANLALMGAELVQFGRAEPLGAGRFRLSRLVRGRRGTEWAMTSHQPGEPFTLLDPASLLPLDLPVSLLGASLHIRATGLGDQDQPVTAIQTLAGHAVRPPAPVHLSAHRLADDTLVIGWIRRSRLGWAWIDGQDAPLGEDEPGWLLTIASETGAGRTVTTSAPGYRYTRAEQIADDTVAAEHFSIAISQHGTVAGSAPAATAQFQN